MILQCDKDIEIFNMTLVNGTIDSHLFVGSGVLTFHEVEMLGALGEECRVTGGSVYRGERATSWLFPYNWLLVISVFPRAKLMFFSYSSLLLVIIYVGSWPHRTI